MFRNKFFRRIVILTFWLMIWLILALAVDNPILLVTPWDAFLRLWELASDLSFWQTVVNSLLRIGTGFLLGLLTAIVLAGISARFSIFEELLQPLMNLMKTVPVASFVVLLLIWWGSSVLATAICFLVVLPNIYINTLEGLKATDVRLLEMAKVFHMPTGNRFFYIYRPALRPFLTGGMKLSLGMCWKSGVAAEVIGTPEYSIGGGLYLSKIHLDTAGVLAWTVVIILLSLCFEKLILWLTDKFFEWNPKMWITDRRRVREKIDVTDSKIKRSRGNDESGGAQPIVLSHVNKSYGEEEVLADVSVTYAPGNTYYLTSPSGSGKTTLLRLLCGLERPDSGEISGAQTCSMVFQEDRLCEDYDAVRNVTMVTGDRQRAREALCKLLEEEALMKPCSQLSGGMKRRVALVRAMEAESDVVLLDEPFTGMDAGIRQTAEHYIKERRGGRTVIIATHI